MNTVDKIYSVKGMTCSGCENTLVKLVSKLDGVKEVKANHAQATLFVKFDPDKTVESDIQSTVNNAGFEFIGEIKSPVKKKIGYEILSVLGMLAIVFAVYMTIEKTVGFNFIPEVNSNMGFGMLFVVGLLTSLHCIAMCGGINISQCGLDKPAESDKKSLKQFGNNFLYNLGRVVSYTLIGGIAGALGSAISLSDSGKIAITMVAGVLMLIIGLKMLGVFRFLHGVSLPLPKFFTPLAQKVRQMGPFFVGILNGFMPCGPLQAMQIYALGTGSFILGALSMFFFSLGTVPLMLGLGVLFTVLSRKFLNNLFKVSAVLVIFLGLLMINRGLSFGGSGVVLQTETKRPVAVLKGDYQEVSSTVTSYSYQSITVQKGVPVQWNIRVEAKDLNGCNNAIVIAELGIRKKLSAGDNLVEFTPEREGVIVFTCWMGMISSVIRVVPDVTKLADNNQPDPAEPYSFRKAGGRSCCSPSPN